MPIGNRKTEPEMPAREPMPANKETMCCNGNCSRHFAADFGKKILMTLVGVLLVYVIVYVGTLMRNNIKKYDFIGQADASERTVTVTGYGKVTGKNDVAVTTIGFTNTDKDVATAQANNKKVMDQVMADLKKMGIEDKDLETNYSIYPQYDYTKGQTLIGYQVNDSVAVKIRDLTKVSDILALAGKYGANNVGGLSFTIDDNQALKDQARAKALEDAKKKAVMLAQSLGLHLVEVVSYNEYEGSPDYQPYTYGMGGGAMDSKVEPPEVASGSEDEVMNVNLTYKVVPNNW